jgi:beta-lactamase class A
MRREVIMTTISRTLVLALVMMLLVPVAFAQDSHLAILREKTESALEEIAAKTGSVLGVAALDLTSGESFEINEDFVFPQGSSIKIPIMMEVWKQAKEGKFSLEERRPVPKQVMVGGSGALQFFSDGRSELSIRDLAVLMIILSDNTATNILIDLVGTDRINATMSSLGLTKTRVQRQMMDVAASAREDENLSTPFEAVEIMKTLHDGSFIDREACDQMLEILKYPKGGGIKRGLPSGVPIAFKGGGIAGVQTEWALVYAENRPFAVAVMRNYGVSGDKSDPLKEIGSLLYNYFWRIGNSTGHGTYVDPGLRK